ncbi:MAG: PKD domain-containing protein, partial [Acidimicrobiia bacterium]
GTLSTSGMKLYVDGNLVASNTAVTKAQVYRGYWRVGGDNLSSWPSAPSREAIAANLDEVAVYPSALSPNRVQAHYAASGRGTLVNTPPVAAFTTQMQDRTVTVNGSGSTDSDGQIVSYAWTFGDGSTASGATPPSHTYAVAGSYDITLTVTDDQGATNSITKSVTATDPGGPVVLASDTFTRTLASGWGTADSGGAWTVSSASVFSVNGTQGLVSTTASGGRSTYLRSVSDNATDTLVTLSSDKVVAGGGMYVSTVGRSIVGAGDYRSVVRFQSDGRVAVRLSRANASGTETIIVPEAVVAGLTYAANDKLLVRTQVTGTSPTTVRVKVWKFGTTEPVAWNQTTTDATATLQAAGSVGLLTYVSGSATNAPILLTVDDLLVTKP